MSFSDVPVLVLCGGLGTRLRSVVPDCPKILVEVGGVPFMDVLLRFISAQGMKKVCLALGYKSEMVIAHLREYENDYRALGLDIHYFVESEPFGTAGAMGFVLNELSELPEQMIVMNGDTFIDVGLAGLINKNDEDKRDMTMVAVSVEDRSRYGALDVQDNLVRGFLEKDGKKVTGLVNGGVYCFRRSLMGELKKSFKEVPVRSLETDEFPRLAVQGGIGCFVHHGVFLDYGTPEGLKKASQEVDVLQQQMMLEKGELK